MRPTVSGRLHSYTLADGRVSVETGAYHAWLRLECQGTRWTGPRPAYLWNWPEGLSAMGYAATVDDAATAEIAASFRRGDDAEFLAAYLVEASVVLACCVELAVTNA